MNSNTGLEPFRDPAPETDEFTVSFHYKTDSGADSTKSLHLTEKLRTFPICMVILEYFKTFANYPSETIFNKLFFANNFVAYIEINYETKEQVPRNVVFLFMESISSAYTKQSSLRQVSTCIRTIMKWGVEQGRFTKLAENDRRSYLAMLKGIPTIPQSTETEEPRLALSQLIEGYDVDDLDLLDSLNHFCWHFLKILQRHRELLKAENSVSNELEALSKIDDGSINLAAWKSAGADLSKYRTIFDAVVKTEDLTIKERILFSCNSYRDSLIQSNTLSNATQLEEALSKCTWMDGSLRQFADPAKGKLYATFSDMDFKHLIAPLPVEEICLRWIMAADRIQSAGQQSIKISDILITPTHCTLAYTKKRSGKTIRCSTAYPKKSWQYKTYVYYTELRKATDNHFPNDAHDLFWLYKSPFKQPQHIGSRNYRLLVLSCLPYSHLHQEIITREPKTIPFIKLLTKVLNRGTGHPKHHLISDPDACSVKKTEICEDVAFKICPGAITQSRAIVDDDSVPTNTPYDRYAKENVDADSTAHSVTTKEFIYKARSETIHRKAKRSSFSKAVNELQEHDARKLLAMLSGSQYLSLKQMKEFLGWPTGHFSATNISEFNELVSAAEKKGFNCTPFGTLLEDASGKKIIIKSPVTVALMLSHKEACDEAADEADNDEQALALSLQSSYISVMLEAFDSKMLKEGHDLHLSPAFPKATI
ncbi:hypothetical protein [Pseudomonas fluorescens]|uniref:Uncharacterized protein n=1 Tax=Pseudomonas fluorescens TaxID=294 RepID=A0A5E7CBJ6_PSEFL|nr:hypothetical protein [Pseudomonas fluorescens]VVO01736.1 hypothetical protein PS691_02685 [Pseudomonas fluorescens]